MIVISVGVEGKLYCLIVEEASTVKTFGLGSTFQRPPTELRLT